MNELQGIEKGGVKVTGKNLECLTGITRSSKWDGTLVCWNFIM